MKTNPCRALTFFTFLIGCWPASFLQAGETIQKPNIVFIMADDLGYGDLGCYGQEIMQTPHIDQLAKQGIRFTQAYAGAPVCTSSRCALMTGMHNGHSAARDNIPHYHTYLEEKDVTVAEVLQKENYRCGGVGKWSLGDAGTVGRATNQGFDDWFGYLNQDHAHYYFPEYLDDNEGRHEFAGNTKSRKHYSHNLLTERALEFIQKSKDKPFFLYAAYTVPHFSSGFEDNDRLAVPHTKPFDHTDWDTKSKKYATMIHLLDRDVGRIVELIEQLGLSENTLIVVTSDHGGNKSVPAQFKTNGPLRGFKRDLTEGGIRVPFIARWTGQIPANQTSHELIAFWDMMPTFAEMAGVELDTPTDGISIVSALMGKTLTKPHEFLYWDYGHCRASGYWQAVRMGRWKAIYHKTRKVIQLYDLDADIGETHDIASAHPAITNRMLAIMQREFSPHNKYEVGKTYKGRAIWKRGK